MFLTGDIVDLLSQPIRERKVHLETVLKIKNKAITVYKEMRGHTKFECESRVAPRDGLEPPT